jgi:hypothetical protein
MDAKSGKKIGAAKIAYSHVGGIAVFEKLGWAFVSDDRPFEVRRYSLKKLADAIRTSDTLDTEGPDQPVINSSFLTSHEPTNTLWAGEFKGSREVGFPHMRAYKVDKATGDLTPESRVYEVPPKTQGVVVTKDFFIYSTSLGRNNRSNLYVVRRGKGETDLDKARLFCFRSPSAGKYNPRPTPTDPRPDRPRNIISNLHSAKLASLEELPPRSGPTRPGPIASDKRRHEP